MNRTTRAIPVLMLAACAGSAGAAMITSASTGYAPVGYVSDAVAELRNLKNSGDFEVGIKNSGASSYLATKDATWVQGVNDLVVTYDIASNIVSVSLNGAAASTALVNDPGSLTLHLIARNAGSNTASLTVQNLAFNGSAIDANGFGGFLFASSAASSGALSNYTNARIDDASMAASSWTLTGQIVAAWTGPAPSKANSRLDISFGAPITIPASADVPAPATAALGATAAAIAAIGRKRRNTN